MLRNDLNSVITVMFTQFYILVERFIYKFCYFKVNILSK